MYTTTMAVRLTPDDAERVRHAAKLCAMEQADFLRAIITDACAAVEEVDNPDRSGAA